MSTTHEYEPFTGFPMPRDPQALVDRSRRPIVRSADSGAALPVPGPERLVHRRRSA